jgi:hypothetical protein
MFYFIYKKVTKFSIKKKLSNHIYHEIDLLGNIKSCFIFHMNPNPKHLLSKN